MRDEYDFTDSTANPYAKQLRKPVTMQLNITTIDYFKQLSGETGIPYQNLINLYLTQAAEQGKTLEFT